MTFKKWLNRFIGIVQGNWMLSMEQLREAWQNGKTPEEAAKANDALSNEYAYAEAA